MRKLMKKSGLTTVILVSLFAMALLPKNVSQWVTLLAVITFAAVKCGSYISARKEEFFGNKEKNNSACKESKTSENDTSEMLNYVTVQLSHRITDKLHSAYPNAMWQWKERPTVKLFAEGGRVRVTTNNTDEFTEAEVILDIYGRIEIEMLKTNSVSEIIKESDTNADTNYTIDADIWYSQCAQKALTDIITDLNARGTKSLCIKADGSLVIGENNQVGVLKAFPAKNLWNKIVSIFEENGLMAVENENGIEIGW